MNESLAYQGRKLKRNNLVNACYTRDGSVTFKINERSKTIKIHHMHDFLELFFSFYFKDEPFHDASPDISGHSMYWVAFASLRICVWFLVIRREGIFSFTWFIYL